MCNYTREDPFKLSAEGKVTIESKVTGQNFTNVRVKCLKCEGVYEVEDHLGYHFNYWSWFKVSSDPDKGERPDQIAIIENEEHSKEKYKIDFGHEILFKNNVLHLKHPVLSSEKIGIIYKRSNDYNILEITYFIGDETYESSIIERDRFNATLEKNYPNSDLKPYLTDINSIPSFLRLLS